MTTEVTVNNFNATFVEQLNENFRAIDAAIDAKSVVQSTDDDQVIIGTDAMPNATAGSARYNVAIGTEALRDVTTTDATVAIGYHAGAGQSTGRTGVYIGHVAGEYVTTGSSNTFVGGYAGRGNSDNPITGVDNTLVGEACGLNLEGAGPNYNTGMGFNALFGLRDGDSNTAVGLGAGLSLVHTSGNTLYGLGAYGWGDGANNVVIGYNAGKGTSQIVYTAGGTTPLAGTTLYFTDTSMMSVGTVLYAGANLKVGTKVTAINANVSVDIDTPVFNAVSEGTQITVLNNQHTGARNVYIGYYSGNSIQGAVDDVTAVGYGSLRYLTTGARNAAFGSYTLGSTTGTTMNDCTAVGYRAGRYVTADDNTAIGASAMRSVSGNPLTGTNNTAVGSDALADLQGAATGNTAVGNACALNITTGSRNTFLGTNIAAHLTTGSDNIIIGPSIDVAAAGTSNYLNIGNAIYGTGILGGTVQIGVNKSSPSATLHVGGTVVADSTLQASTLTATSSSALGATAALTGTAWGSLSAAGTAGRVAFVNNAGTDGALFWDTGSRWKPVGGMCTLKTLDSASSSIGNSQTVVFQYQIPAGLWQVGDRLRLYAGLAKSGTADNLTFAIRIGTAGTTSDTAIVSSTVLQATFRQNALIMDVRLESATSAQLLPAARGTSALPPGYGIGTTTALDSPVTISSASANALYYSVTILSSGTTDTVQLIDAQLQLVSRGG